MPVIDITLDEDVPPEATVTFPVPGLRPGDVLPGTAGVTIGGFEQPDVRLSVDFTLQTVDIMNQGPDPWRAGARLVLAWEGDLLEDRVITLEANPGVTDGSEAAPGQVGEYLTFSNIIGADLASDVPASLCPITLSPGDWEVWGAVDFTPPGNVSPNMIAASISLYPDALPTEDDLISGTGVLNMFSTSSLLSGERQVLMTGNCRSNAPTQLNLYLVAQTRFTGASTVNAKGYISARRAR